MEVNGGVNVGGDLHANTNPIDDILDKDGLNADNVLKPSEENKAVANDEEAKSDSDDSSSSDEEPEVEDKDQGNDVSDGPSSSNSSSDEQEEENYPQNNISENSDNSSDEQTEKEDPETNKNSSSSSSYEEEDDRSNTPDDVSETKDDLETPNNDDVDLPDETSEANNAPQDSEMDDEPGIQENYIANDVMPDSVTDKDGEETAVCNTNNQLHGNNLSDSGSSSEDETTGPLVIRQLKEEPEDDASDLAQSLKRALEERDKQQQKPIEPLHFDESEFVSDVDDASLRARKADDFKIEPAPPSLPPKMKDKTKSILRKDNPLGIIHVGDKTDSLERGRWSDDDDDENVPPAHRHKPPGGSHSPPDRIIDFSTKSPKSSKGPKRNDSGSRRHRDPMTRVINLPKHPEDINDVYKRQAMVSLHSSAHPYSLNEASDPYDSVQDDGSQDLNKLIKEANSLDINPHVDQRDDAIDVLYPSYKRSLPPKKKLDSSYPDTFAKLATNKDVPVPVKPVEEIVQFSAIPQGPLNEYPRSLPRKRKPHTKEDPLPTSRDPQDGDDEISIAESDFRFPVPPPDVHKSLDATPYLCEVYPSDYTDFESASETDATETNEPQSLNPLHHDITPYDTVADLETDWDVPKSKDNDLNPIVSEDYRICTDLSKNRNTFPRRMKGDKPKPKERVSLNMMAIALTDPSTNSNLQPTSLPYHGEAKLRRNKSNPSFSHDSAPTSLFGQMPHIVVTRGPTAPQGYQADPLAVYNGPKTPSLPKKKNKPKSEENTAPKIHLSLGQNSNTESDGAINPNNLQINVLPSEDPNVINLNIRTTSSTAPKKQEIIIRDPTPEASPLQIQPVIPITAISHRTPSVPPPESPDQVPSQHRVVDVAPIIISAPPPPQQPEPAPVVVYEPQIVPQQLPYTVQQMPPQTTYPMVPQQQVQAVMAPPPQPIITQQTTVFEQPLNPSSQPSKVVVDITNPWEERNRTLPSQSDVGLRHGGDSGIDLTNYEGRTRPKGVISSSSSSGESDYDIRRKSSKRKLTKSVDNLSNDGLPNEYMEWYTRQYMKPSCCYLFIKHFMFVLNLLFGLIGLALISLGIWGFVDLVQNGLENPHLILRDPIFPVFIIGIVIALACINGAIGFLRDNICMLKFFGWCLVLLCIAFVGGGIAFWVLRAETINPFVYKSFKEIIDEYNTTSRKVAAFTIDTIQSNFQCCGMKDDSGYMDWKDDKAFPCDTNECMLPSSCCSDSQDACTHITSMKHHQGCINATYKWVKNNTPVIVGVWIAIIVLFVINFICIYFMIKEILYLHAIRDKILAIDDSQSELGSSEDTSESEYEERRRRRRRRKRKRRNRKTRNYHVNKAYR